MHGRFRVHPGHGVGPFVIGLVRDELVAAVGEPEAVEAGSLAGQGFENWTYDDGGIEVRFDDDDHGRASWVVVSDPRAVLAGIRPIGMPERDFLRRMREAGLGPIHQVDDFGDGLRDYEWPAVNLSFWVSEGRVESVTVMPFYDQSGDVPLWPLDARIDGAPR